MQAIIHDKYSELLALCEKYGVKRLELFGSALDPQRFNPETSDLDFLVEFDATEIGKHANAYFGLLFDLEALFGREIDLVERSAIRNPYFMDEVEETNETIYAAA